MWISNNKYQDLLTENRELQDKVFLLEEQSGENTINKLNILARKCNLNIHSDEYQSMMTRVFLDLGGRESSVLKAYSGTTFMKDNPTEILERLKEFQQQANIITKNLENKK